MLSLFSYETGGGGGVVLCFMLSLFFMELVVEGSDFEVLCYVNSFIYES
jgi:hypothetical protein